MNNSSPFGSNNGAPKRFNNNNNANNWNNNNLNNNQYNNNAAKNSAIRQFDIGNNAKYAKAKQMARNTNTLSSNFWDDDDDDESDSLEERKESNDVVANRWKATKSNINSGPIKMDQNINQNSYQNVKQIQPKFHGVYEESSSDDDDDDDNFDGFEKYIPPKPNDDILEMERKKKEEDYWKNNNTKWIVLELNKKWEYDTIWFKVEKMRNGKANGKQMRPFMEKSGLSHDELKKIWKLSDLDKDGKMGNEEFSLCMLLMEETKNGKKIPEKLPMNYIPPSFRGKPLVKTPPKKAVKAPIEKSLPPTMRLNDDKGNNDKGNISKPLPTRKPLPSYMNNSNNKGNISRNISKPLPTTKPLPTRMNMDKSGGYDIKPKQKQIEIKPSSTTQAVAPNMNTNMNTNMNANNGRNMKPNTSPFGTPSQQENKAVVQRKIVNTPNNGNNTGNINRENMNRQNMNNQGVGNRYNSQQTQHKKPMPMKCGQQETQQESAQFMEMDLEEIKKKSMETATKAGIHAKKAGVAALGWMTKKMNQLNDKAQEPKDNTNKKPY